MDVDVGRWEDCVGEVDIGCSAIGDVVVLGGVACLVFDGFVVLVCVGDGMGSFVEFVVAVCWREFGLYDEVAVAVDVMADGDEFTVGGIVGEGVFSFVICGGGVVDGLGPFYVVMVIGLVAGGRDVGSAIGEAVDCVVVGFDF